MDYRSTSRCDEARELLWPLDELRAATDDEAEARAHLASCEPCRAFFTRDAALAAALGRADVAAPAPPALIARIADHLRAEPGESEGSGSEGGLEAARRISSRRRPGRGLGAWLAPLAAAAAISVAAIGLLRVGPEDVDALYVASYLDRDAESTVVSTSDADQAYQFFMRELGVPVSPVLFGEGRVNRAMICLIDGERTAMVEYELDGHMVAHYRGPITSEDGGGALHSATEDGVCVVRWSDGEFQHALVADIPEDELRGIAVRQFAALR